MSEYFTRPLSESDPLVATALADELRRQQELIASKNIVSRAVLDALGHAITNKTLEGYPGNRFHGGGEFVDVVEQAAIDRARELFGCDYVNVQPHSGTQANQAVFFATARPGDRILSLNLAAGGHLCRGDDARHARGGIQAAGRTGRARGAALRETRRGRPGCRSRAGIKTLSALFDLPRLG